MGVKERRLRQKEEVRSSILSTAWQMARADGWQSLSIRKIADAIEYSVPVIYDHFENKEAILIEFSRQGFDLLVKKLQKAKAKYDSPEEQLIAIAEAYWDFAFANKEYYQIMFSLGVSGCEMSKCIPAQSVFEDIIWDAINAILLKNDLPEDSTCLKYHTFWSMLHGMVSVKLTAPSASLNNFDKLVLDDAMHGFIKNLQR
ncbi:MAG: TetR/AcrR family transcriptional regulator [Mucilaginibacter polytrichastri]|nr:TetR/AcrR family transcriptional regulator [Mucilaginibacter polytrichastri]